MTPPDIAKFIWTILLLAGLALGITSIVLTTQIKKASSLQEQQKLRSNRNKTGWTSVVLLVIVFISMFFIKDDENDGGGKLKGSRKKLDDDERRINAMNLQRGTVNSFTNNVTSKFPTLFSVKPEPQDDQGDSQQQTLQYDTYNVPGKCLTRNLQDGDEITLTMFKPFEGTTRYEITKLSGDNSGLSGEALSGEGVTNHTQHKYLRTIKYKPNVGKGCQAQTKVVTTGKYYRDAEIPVLSLQNNKDILLLPSVDALDAPVAEMNALIREFRPALLTKTKDKLVLAQNHFNKYFKVVENGEYQPGKDDGIIQDVGGDDFTQTTLFSRVNKKQ